MQPACTRLQPARTQLQPECLRLQHGYVRLLPECSRLQPACTRLQPLSHTVTASITYGHSLHHVRLQPLLRTVTGEPELLHGRLVVLMRPGVDAAAPHRAEAGRVAVRRRGHVVPGHVRLQPGSQGCSVDHIGLQCGDEARARSYPKGCMEVPSFQQALSGQRKPVVPSCKSPARGSAAPLATCAPRASLGGFRCFWCAGVQVCRCAGVQVCRFSGSQVF